MLGIGLIAWMSIPLCVRSQNQYTAIGANVGYYVPKLKANSKNPVVSGYSTLGRPRFGIVIENGLSKRLSLSSEFIYGTYAIEKNGDLIIPGSIYKNFGIAGLAKEGNLYADFYARIEIKTIDIPVMVKYKFAQTEDRSFYVGGGAYCGIMTKATIHTTGNSLVYTDKERTKLLVPLRVNLVTDQTVTDIVVPVNWGLLAGAGWEKKIGPGRFQLGLTGCLGLTDVQWDPKDGSNKMSYVTLTGAYLIDL